tara:strand:- start:92 stop:358 length:267 start_codon:yes stop_codon:yes gene_type:complete
MAIDWYKEMHGPYGNMSKGVYKKNTLNDSIVDSVKEKYQSRSETGIKKYNTTLDRDDLTEEEWLVHLQEELMDATLYIEKLITLIKNK